MKVKLEKDKQLQIKSTPQLNKFYVENTTDKVTAGILRTEFLNWVHPSDNQQILKLLEGMNYASSNDMNNCAYKLSIKYWNCADTEKAQETVKSKRVEIRAQGRPAKKQKSKVILPTKHFYSRSATDYMECRESPEYEDQFMLTSNEKLFANTVAEEDCVLAVKQGILPDWWMMMDRTINLLELITPRVTAHYLHTVNSKDNVYIFTQKQWLEMKKDFNSSQYFSNLFF